MSKPLFPNDIILDDPRFLALGFESLGADFSRTARFDRARALSILKEDPSLGASFLYRTSGSGSILWGGPEAGTFVDGQSAGVRVINRRTGAEYDGDNAFGTFLSAVRRDYVNYLRTSVLPEVPVAEGQVITDFRRKGEDRSDIERAEEQGGRFIHTDRYVPSRFRFDADRRGTTGHSGRESDDEVSFHRWECPFGLSYPSPVIVGSSAEASFLYERALRGELDWGALFDSLVARGLMKKLGERERAAAVSRYQAQFAWMREQISIDPALSGLQVVSSSALVPDTSMGRSQYDPELAPSPAHVLARYINNPYLLYSPSQNGVIRALGADQHNEPERLALKGQASSGTFRILVLGSDTIGGREPGRKATQKTAYEETRNEEGQPVVVQRTRMQMPLKPRDEREQDYQAFAARLDAVLSDLPPSASIQLVTGSASTLSDGVGVGTPQLVERYVRERGGRTSAWDFSAGRAVQKAAQGGEAGRQVTRDNLESITMEHLADCFPVLTGRDGSVSFLLNASDDSSEVSFSAGKPGHNKGFRASAAVVFSASEDTSNANVLALGSAVASAGLPVVHVQQNRSEQDQQTALQGGAVLSLATFSGGEVVIAEPLFPDGAEPRTDWDIAGSNDFSLRDAQLGVAEPLVSSLQESSVSVGGISFSSVYGTYVALVAQAVGEGSLENLRAVAAADGSTRQLTALLEGFLQNREFPSDMQERCLRQAVRLMASSDQRFSWSLLDMDDRPVVVASSVSAGNLFVTPDGKGENRFGMVLAAERDMMKQVLEARIQQEQADLKKSLQQAQRRQAAVDGVKAAGEKVRGGLPSNAEEAAGAVWFLGTHRDPALELPDGNTSFVMWNDLGGSDPLVREKAARPWVDDGMDGRLDNEFVFLFPSDLKAVTGMRRPSYHPDSRDLTDVMRTDPKTGKQFVCAYGVPVKMNNRSDEFLNDDGMPCSFRLNNDSANVLAGVIVADSAARTTALKHGQTLCISGRERLDGSKHYHLYQVFLDKVWKKVEGKDGKARGEWVPNPHAAPLNAGCVSRYVRILEEGQNYPLNMMVLPSADYHSDSYGPVEQNQFLSDVMMSLRLANATAVSLGVPLRIPLGPDGKVDLGPGVPDELRDLASRRIDSFIGASNESLDLKGELPLITRVPVHKTLGLGPSFAKSGSDVYFRPNDLATAFGGYDFHDLLSGKLQPMHEMAFAFDDGSLFRLTDTKMSKNVDRDTQNAYIRYEKNDERRFVVYTNAPDRVDEFLTALKGYVSRSKLLKVEARLLRDTESQDHGLEGYVNLLSSNSDRFAESEHDIGHEMTVFNGSSRFDGEQGNDYWGRVDAKDGFSGYAQVRYTGPDGVVSQWQTVTDLELAKDMVLTMVNRVYRSDERRLPSENAMRILITGEAARNAPDYIRTMDVPESKEIKIDTKVVDIRRTEGPRPSAPAPAPEAPAPRVQGGREADIAFTVSEGTYSKRTWENANASDVDFTLALAADWNTAGERCTRKAAGTSLIDIDLPLAEGGLDLSDKALDRAASQVVDVLPDLFVKGEPFGLNIAGNGIYTLQAKGVSQDQADEFVTRLLGRLRDRGLVLDSVRTGGQTGIDEAGAAAAAALGIPVTVHAPKGWTYRDGSNRDVSGEQSFKDRFRQKDLNRLQALTQMQTGRRGARSEIKIG